MAVASSRLGGFRYSVYSDMLFNWPEGQGDDYILQYEDQINLGASGENAEFSVAQISTDTIGMNLVAFYLLSGRRLFVFSGHDNGLPVNCRTFADIEPMAIEGVLREITNVEANWYLMITAAPREANNSLPRSDQASNPNHGIGIPFFVHANTFPGREA